MKHDLASQCGDFGGVHVSLADPDAEFGIYRLDGDRGPILIDLMESVMGWATASVYDDRGMGRVYVGELYKCPYDFVADLYDEACELRDVSA